MIFFLGTVQPSGPSPGAQDYTCSELMADNEARDFLDVHLVPFWGFNHSTKRKRKVAFTFEKVIVRYKRVGFSSGV